MRAPDDSNVDIAAELARLAALDPIAYELEREKAAKRLGFRVGILDQLVAGLRPKTTAEGGAGTRLNLPEVDPWPESVDAAALLSMLADAILHHVVMSKARGGRHRAVDRAHVGLSPVPAHATARHRQSGEGMR